MKYTITTQAQRILPGWQADTTIVNQGPGTVYVGVDGSVSAINGFPLKPTASMTWDANNELWLVSASSSSVIAEPVAQLINTPNVLPFDLLYSGPGTVQTFSVECGSYSAVRLVVHGPPSGGVGNNFVGYTFTWFDVNGNQILVEDVWGISDPLFAYDALQVVPVKGTSVTITIPYTNNSLVNVFGDNRSNTLYTGYVQGNGSIFRNGGSASAPLVGTPKQCAANFNNPAIWTGTAGVGNPANALVLGAVGYASLVTITYQGIFNPNNVTVMTPIGPIAPTSLAAQKVNPGTSSYGSVTFIQPAELPVSITGFIPTNVVSSLCGVMREPLPDGGASFLKQPSGVQVSQNTGSNAIALTANTWALVESMSGSTTPASFTVNSLNDIVYVTISYSAFVDTALASLYKGVCLDHQATPTSWITQAHQAANSWYSGTIAHVFTGLSIGTHTVGGALMPTANCNLVATGFNCDVSVTVVPGN